MTEDERLLAEDRALRDAARAVFNARLARLRAALAEKGLASRMADEAKGRLRTTADDAAVVARDSRWIVVGTGLALLAWLLRRPIMQGAGRLREAILLRLPGREPAPWWRRWLAWLQRKVGP